MRRKHSSRKLFEKKLEVPFLSEGFRRLLQECMCKDLTRYGRNRLSIDKDNFTVTDGCRLLNFEMPNDFEPGLYHITNDGYCLLDKNSGTFPKWRDGIVPTELKVVLKLSYIDSGNAEGPGSAFYKITYELPRAGSFFDIDMLQRTLALLHKVKCSFEDVEICYSEVNRPFVIRGKVKYWLGPGDWKEGKFLYVQMPINNS